MNYYSFLLKSVYFMRWSERNIKEKKKELVKLKISGWTKYRNKSRCRHVRTSKINPVHVHCFLKQSINLAQNAHSTTYLNDSVLFSLFSFLYAFLKIFWKKKKIRDGERVWKCGKRRVGGSNKEGGWLRRRRWWFRHPAREARRHH